LFKKLTKSKTTLVDAQYCAKGRRLPSCIVVLFWDYDSCKVARTFEKEPQGDVTLVPGSKGLYLEIISGHVQKGQGLQDFCHSIDIALSKCVAIGAGNNDVEFLDMAGFGICMKVGNKQTKHMPDAPIQWG
jgi:hydroxymethylpyrimidine pyrophosphatase-like HAD family hydrolase